MLNRVLAALAILFVALWYPVVWFIIATTNSVGVVATASDMTFDSTMSAVIGLALTLVILSISLKSVILSSLLDILESHIIPSSN